MTRAALVAFCVALLIGGVGTLEPSTPFASAEPRRSFGAVAPPVRLIPKSETLGVQGLHDYFDTVEIGAASDGLVVSNRLTLERYLLGLNEVPTEWPAEALRAQAVAARTYALWTLSQPPGGSAATYGFDICATVECQVFSGAEVVQLASGARWAQAVVDTAGTAVLYDDRPILARYHSTSGGTTFDNPDAFPEEPDYPYLKAVPSTTETASPVYRWRVTFTLDRLTAILRHGGTFTRRVLSVRTVAPQDGGPYPDVVITGRTPQGRTSVRMPADSFRDAVREEAPALYPDLYPSAWHTTSGRLPETLPSERIEVATKGGRVVVNGRGWGHGTGMSQWGAYGLAQQGATFDQILTHYYTDVSIGRINTEVPIEVGVATGQPSVAVSGDFSIIDGAGNTIVRDALGTWNFTDAGGAVGIDPPPGFGLPLEVGIVRAPKRVDVGEPVFLTIALSRPAQVRAETVGDPERNPRTRVKEAGKRRITWLAPLEAGSYRVRVRAAIGGTKRFSKPIGITVRDRPVAAQPPQPEEDPGSGSGRSLWFALGAVAFVGIVSIARLFVMHR